MDDLICSICGGNAFREQKVLWAELVAEWQLNEAERNYIDRQQGCSCLACGANLRIIALGNAIRALVGTPLPLRQAIGAGAFEGWRVLDCNGAEGISAVLALLPGYLRADYPEYDMHCLPFADGSFDLLVHSDTLEHIEHPVLALEECRRVLNARGRLCYTVPIIHERLSRSRAGLSPSYHGEPAAGRADFLVQTEFGADAWTLVHRAGFTDLTLSQVQFPCAIAITAWTAPPIRE